MQTQKHLISSVNKQTHRLDRSNRTKLSQTRLVLRCDNCGGLPRNTKEVLEINDCGLCPNCQEFLDIRGLQIDANSEYETEFHDES